MGMREKIAEALYEPPKFQGGILSDIARNCAERRADAVMEVVEEEIETRIAAAIHEDRTRLAADHATTRDHLHTENERMVTRVRELEEENRALREKMTAINLVKTWTNEDGHSFMFTDDLLLALGEVTPEALARARQLKEKK